MIVAVRSIGPLAKALGGKRVEVVLPDEAAVAELLERLAREKPGAARFLGAEGPSSARVFRVGRLLDTQERLHARDVLDLVVAIAGG